MNVANIMSGEERKMFVANVVGLAVAHVRLDHTYSMESVIFFLKAITVGEAPTV